MQEILVDETVAPALVEDPRSKEEIAFLRDVAQHQMLVLRDTPSYRHIAYRNPEDSECHFEILTWPGKLCYSGDMGTYVFSRTHDMFEFFRSPRTRAKNSTRPLNIDYRYWAEKLEASCRAGVKEFDFNKFKTNVELLMSCFEFPLAAREECRDVVFDAFDVYSSKDLAMHELFEFQYKDAATGKIFSFNNVEELDCESYTHSFLWCCHAISWAIEMYDNAVAEKMKEPSDSTERKHLVVETAPPC